MMKLPLILGIVFLLAASAAFGVLEARTPVFRTLTGSAKTTKQATVVFVGDMMFDRYIRTVLAREGDAAVLAPVRDYLENADLTIGNLEGPITDNPSQSQGTKVGDATNMRFTFAPSVASLLADYGFDLVSIGNNHILDFGVVGVRSTTNYLSGADIAYVGDPTGSSPEPVVKVVNGIRIAFVAYSDFIAGDADRAREALQRSDADATVLLAHWGNEYESEPPARVRELAASFIASGADLIIGTHSHVIGSSEDVQGARVYYSLGNFVFDQYWEPSVRCGLAVTATFKKGADGTVIIYTEDRVGMTTSGATVLGCS